MAAMAKHEFATGWMEWRSTDSSGSAGEGGCESRFKHQDFEISTAGAERMAINFRDRIYQMTITIPRPRSVCALLSLTLILSCLCFAQGDASARRQIIQVRITNHELTVWPVRIKPGPAFLWLQNDTQLANVKLELTPDGSAAASLRAQSASNSAFKRQWHDVVLTPGKWTLVLEGVKSHRATLEVQPQ